MSSQLWYDSEKKVLNDYQKLYFGILKLEFTANGYCR